MLLLFFLFKNPPLVVLKYRQWQISLKLWIHNKYNYYFIRYFNLGQLAVKDDFPQIFTINSNYVFKSEKKRLILVKLSVNGLIWLKKWPFPNPFPKKNLKLNGVLDMIVTFNLIRLLGKPEAQIFGWFSKFHNKDNNCKCKDNTNFKNYYITTITETLSLLLYSRHSVERLFKENALCTLTPLSTVLCLLTLTRIYIDCLNNRIKFSGRTLNLLMAKADGNSSCNFDILCIIIVEIIVTIIIIIIIFHNFIICKQLLYKREDILQIW